MLACPTKLVDEGMHYLWDSLGEDEKGPGPRPDWSWYLIVSYAGEALSGASAYLTRVRSQPRVVRFL
jgi:hypothetical protein